MRLLKTRSHTSERQGSVAGRLGKNREGKESLVLKGKTQSSTQAITVPPATWVGRERAYGKAKCEHKHDHAKQYHNTNHEKTASKYTNLFFVKRAYFV